MIHILHVISDSNIGGAGRLLLYFLRGFDRTKFRVSVALPVGSELCGEIRNTGVEYFEIDGLAEKSLSFAGVRNMRRLIRRVRPDIVHTHASMSARIAARLCGGGVRIIYTRHCVFPSKKALTVFPGKMIAGFVNNILADRIVAISHPAAENVIETGGDARKIEVMYNGADAIPTLSAEERAAVRVELGLSPDTFLCGIFARLNPVKGQEYILDAAKMLLNETDVKIIIAGAGELEGEIRRRIADEGLTNVLFVGFLQKPGRIMAALDVQLNASYGTETSCLSVLEGFSAGVPAIASDYGGNPYIIDDGEAGIIVPQRDGKVIADAVRRLRGDRRLLKEMSEKAVKVYFERFTSEIMVRNMERVYLSVKD